LISGPFDRLRDRDFEKTMSEGIHSLAAPWNREEIGSGQGETQHRGLFKNKQTNTVIE
jgi:hypothetical protein